MNKQLNKLYFIVTHLLVHVMHMDVLPYFSHLNI